MEWYSVKRKHRYNFTIPYFTLMRLLYNTSLLIESKAFSESINN